MKIKDVSQYWDRVIHKNNNVGQTRTWPVHCTYYYIKNMDFPIKNEEVDSAHYQFSSWNHSNSGHSNKKVEVKDLSSCIKRPNCAIHYNNNIGETTRYHVLSKCTIVCRFTIVHFMHSSLGMPNQEREREQEKVNSRKD